MDECVPGEHSARPFIERIVLFPIESITATSLAHSSQQDLRSIKRASECIALVVVDCGLIVH